MGHLTDFSRELDLKQELFFINTFNPNYDHNYLFVDAGWNAAPKVGGLGFVVISSKREFLFAGCKRVESDSSLEAELMVMNIGLEIASTRCNCIQTIFTDYLAVKVAIYNQDEAVFWREK